MVDVAVVSLEQIVKKVLTEKFKDNDEPNELTRDIQIQTNLFLNMFEEIFNETLNGKKVRIPKYGAFHAFHSDNKRQKNLVGCAKECKDIVRIKFTQSRFSLESINGERNG